MKLIEYLKPLPPAEREAFALRCETTIGHLRNVMYEDKPCGPALAVLIERHSAGKVTRQELRPSDWAAFWPELAQREAA